MSVFPDLTTDVGKSQTHEARRDLYRSQQARLNFWRAAAVSSFFIVVAGASLFLGAVIVIGTIRGADSSNELTADGRTGRIARTLRDGTLCHYIVFDNKTAQAVEDRIGRCDEGKPKPKPEKPPMFKWGGQ
ncbi:MAG: hypothetical protein WBG10_02570 [Pseudolabrys sp.]